MGGWDLAQAAMVQGRAQGVQLKRAVATTAMQSGRVRPRLRAVDTAVPQGLTNECSRAGGGAQCWEDRVINTKSETKTLK